MKACSVGQRWVLYSPTASINVEERMSAFSASMLLRERRLWWRKLTNSPVRLSCLDILSASSSKIPGPVN